MKFKTRFNLQNFFILIFGLINLILFVSDWVIAIMFIGTFTVLGIILNLVEASLFVGCFDYLEYYLNNKNQ